MAAVSLLVIAGLVRATAHAAVGAGALTTLHQWDASSSLQNAALQAQLWETASWGEVATLAKQLANIAAPLSGCLRSLTSACAAAGAAAATLLGCMRSQCAIVLALASLVAAAGASGAARAADALARAASAGLAALLPAPQLAADLAHAAWAKIPYVTFYMRFVPR